MSDHGSWSPEPVARPRDPIIATLVDLADAEFRAGRFEAAAEVTLLACQRAPDEPAPQRLLAQAEVRLSQGYPPEDRRAEFRLALGEAHRLLGDSVNAASQNRAALGFDDDLTAARVGLSRLHMSGEITPVGFGACMRRSLPRPISRSVSAAVTPFVSHGLGRARSASILSR